MERVILIYYSLFCFVCLNAAELHKVSEQLMAEINQAIMEKQLIDEPNLIIGHPNDEGKWVVDTLPNKAPKYLFKVRNDARINEGLLISPIDTLFFLEYLSAEDIALVLNKRTALFIQKVMTIHHDSISYHYTMEQCDMKSRYPKLYHHIIEWDTTALRSYKYNLRILGEFYSWYLTRVCIEHDHVCDIDFIILPDEPFWDSASALIFNNLLEQRCKSGSTMNIDYPHRANGQCHNQIKNQWCEPNAEREFARAMLRRSPLMPEDYQDNVRAVIDGQGALEEVNNNYPYGALMGGGTLGGNQGVQPYIRCQGARPPERPRLVRQPGPHVRPRAGPHPHHGSQG